MQSARAAHSATRLTDGRVLVLGGFRGNEETVAENELFDPRRDVFVAAPNMKTARVGHTATLLKDGRVLVVGGWSAGRRVDSVEIYDPAQNHFTPVAGLAAPRADHTATLLEDGRVVIIGGFSGRNQPQARAELFDPQTNTFQSAGSLHTARSGHTATRLPDGTVLIAGGTARDDRVIDSAELFDPNTQSFVRTGNLLIRRRKHAAITLDGQRVLIIGGTDEREWDNPYASTEIYDAQTRQFGAGPRLNNTRFKLQDAVTQLPGGGILVAGGAAQIELLDAGYQQFRAEGNVGRDYFFSAATLLEDGRVLITGGYDRRINATSQAWLY
jgi:hypothetical protein